MADLIASRRTVRTARPVMDLDASDDPGPGGPDGRRAVPAGLGPVPVGGTRAGGS
ncbi:hypothetical protein [Streptantibioticus silvisoli]|uniref:Uncharacterized protein n=1 Tax=Streptantibioticus silvisoli TaxID=2705255 RepID=A0ABT6W532_9ACTN|nr:hypothetical protein [Streptantibioticus silvisoli]MDI5965865.1 hypothetical protein [Streptantibioticus silvisoli]